MYNNIIIIVIVPVILFCYRLSSLRGFLHFIEDLYHSFCDYSHGMLLYPLMNFWALDLFMFVLETNSFSIFVTHHQYHVPSHTKYSATKCWSFAAFNPLDKAVTLLLSINVSCVLVNCYQEILIKWCLGVRGGGHNGQTMTSYIYRKYIPLTNTVGRYCKFWIKFFPHWLMKCEINQRGKMRIHDLQYELVIIFLLCVWWVWGRFLFMQYGFKLLLSDS